MHSTNPATGETVWHGQPATADDVNRAVATARAAFPQWAATGFEQRAALAQRFTALVQEHKADLAEAIARETGKPLWDAATEVAAMAGKTAISIQAYHERSPSKTLQPGGMSARLSHRPHGVVAVFGPYNFPAHLPNGHIVPALLAGNVVLFKPSELTPGVAELTLSLWQQAGLPEGVLQLVQGERETGAALAAYPGLDGLFFTGSSATGRILSQQFASQPQKILALEMGGNNPLIVWDSADVQAAAHHTILSAFITSGQRCTCARRLIIPQDAAGDALLEELVAQTRQLTLGAYSDQPEPFYGPLVHRKEVDRLLTKQAQLAAQGGSILLQAEATHPTLPFVSAGIIDVTAVAEREDEEIFGPFLQVIRVASFEDALAEANNTRYGLAAAIFTDREALYHQALAALRAGLVNWNRQTTGASSALPFGGSGISGNHRAAGYYAADYCAYPVASIESDTLELPATRLPGMS